MSGRTKKKLRIDEESDRLSSLPDDIIHHILSFLDTRVAVQTSILSNRWKLIWTTLPFLQFKPYDFNLSKRKIKSGLSDSINHVLFRRNHQSHVLKLKLFFPQKIPETEKVIKYAISHNVKELKVVLWHYHPDYKLSSFSSNSIEKLKLKVFLQQSSLESDFWDLPALTSLHLASPVGTSSYPSPISYLMCLPALTTLRLEGYNFLKSSFSFPGLETLRLTNCNFLESSFSLPGLKALHLSRCNLPERFWELPSLLSLKLDFVVFPEHMSDFIFAHVSLQNLAISFDVMSVKDLLISCPQLVSLQISTCFRIFPCNIMVLAPKLCNFSSVGTFPITFGVSELETVNLKLWNCTGTNRGREELKQHCKRFISMFPVVGSTKILTLDSYVVEALSVVSDLLVHFPSPFYNLKYVKLPQGYKESSLCSATKNYLLAGSPRATIVTTLPQNNMILQAPPVSVTAQSVVLEEPLGNPIKRLFDSQDIHELCVDTVDMRVQEEHVVDNAVEEADGVGQVDVPVAGASNDRACSCRGNSDCGLWQGHEVNLEFVGLLDLIMEKYPETFEHFTSKSKKVYTMKLNMLCSSVNAFIKMSLTDVSSEMIIEYRDLLADFQRWGFNVNWLTSRLNYVEQIQFSHQELHTIDSLIDDAKSKLQELQTLRVKKMANIQKDFGNMGNRLITCAGYIGEGLFSGL